MMQHSLSTLSVITGLVIALAPASEAVIHSYYVGVDGQQTIPTGEFAGQANPNYNRLTFLYAHPNETSPASNHYHSKGVYRYQPGSAASPVIEINPGNYLPEGTNPPLSLVAGSGFYSDKLVVLADAGNHFSHFEIAGTDDLASYAAGTPEHFMFHSSDDRWSGSFAGADVHLVLVSLSPGLHVGDATSFDVGLNQAGDELHLGEAIQFTPVFWTASDAAEGIYIAQFKLVDETGTFGDSGTFEYRFSNAAAVPEPSIALLSGLALTFGLVRRRR